MNNLSQIYSFIYLSLIKIIYYFECLEIHLIAFKYLKQKIHQMLILFI